MFKFVDTCMCPICGKIRRMHTSKEKAICSAATKVKFNSQSTTRRKKLSKAQVEGAGKYFAEIDK